MPKRKRACAPPPARPAAAHAAPRSNFSKPNKAAKPAPRRSAPAAAFPPVSVPAAAARAGGEDDPRELLSAVVNAHVQPVQEALGGPVLAALQAFAKTVVEFDFADVDEAPAPLPNPRNTELREAAGRLRRQLARVAPEEEAWERELSLTTAPAPAGAAEEEGAEELEIDDGLKDALQAADQVADIASGFFASLDEGVVPRLAAAVHAAQCAVTDADNVRADAQKATVAVKAGVQRDMFQGYENVENPQVLVRELMG